MFSEELKSTIANASSVAIFSHMRPDGDTLGSALALMLALRAANKTVDVFCESEIDPKYYYLPYSDEFKRVFSGEYQLYIAVDCADITRLGKLSGDFALKKETVNIDHHTSNTSYAKLNFVSDEGATAEILYELLHEMKYQINTDIATALMVGISTDTGGFTHKNVTPRTLIVASKLLALGANLNEIDFYMHKNQSKARAQMFASVMNRQRILLDDRLSIAFVSREDLEKYGAKESETEGFIDFQMSISTVEVAICLMETGTFHYKASFRSKGKVDVNALAGNFGGGGHTLASGCMLSGRIEDVIEKLTRLVSLEL